MKTKMSDREVGDRVLRRADALRKKRESRLRRAGILSATGALALLVVGVTALSPGEQGTVQDGVLAAQGTAGGLALRDDIGGYILLGLLGCLVLGLIILGICRWRKRAEETKK